MQPPPPLLLGNTTPIHPSSLLLPLAASILLPTPTLHPEQDGYHISEEYLTSLSEEECIWRFRFTTDELIELSDVLELGDPMKTKSGYSMPAIKALGLLCARLCSMEDQWSLATKYAWPQSVISEIVNMATKFIDKEWGHLLDWDYLGIVSPSNLCCYAEALYAFGAPSHSIIGFIDCMIRPTCCPGEDQELVYTSYKKVHGFKCQGIVTPNSLFTHLSGPYRAPQNDNGILHESDLIASLAQYALQPNSTPNNPPIRRFFQLYSDSAYSISPQLLSPYSSVSFQTPEQCNWNKAMGGIHISVEHAFGHVVVTWPFVNAFWKHKIFGMACSLFYHVAILLTNAHSCVHPNQTAHRYKCMPPSLSEYFHK